MSDTTKSIRVHILGREYALRVQEDDEAHTRRVAAFVNERMERFQDAHPEQAELTTAVITALSLAEELHLLREQQDDDTDAVTDALGRLSSRLTDALDAPPES